MPNHVCPNCATEKTFSDSGKSVGAIIDETGWLAIMTTGGGMKWICSTCTPILVAAVKKVIEISGTDQFIPWQIVAWAKKHEEPVNG